MASHVAMVRGCIPSKPPSRICPRAQAMGDAEVGRWLSGAVRGGRHRWAVVRRSARRPPRVARLMAVERQSRTTRCLSAVYVTHGLTTTGGWASGFLVSVNWEPQKGPMGPHVGPQKLGLAGRNWAVRGGTRRCTGPSRHGGALPSESGGPSGRDRCRSPGRWTSSASPSRGRATHRSRPSGRPTGR